MTNLPPSHYLKSGHFGEDLVAQWLQSTGWIILHRRFSCRWGEIDIIAEYSGGGVEQTSRGDKEHNSSPPTPHSPLPTPNSILAFVEVKTRSSGSWDAGGRSAITAQKQAKISRTAGIFLAQYPEKADYTCRFDVAIVCSRDLSKKMIGVTATQEALATSSAAGYEFRLQEYIPAAFDCLIDNSNG
ncbi:MAG: YraN family protein [Nostoc sp. ChiSLP02]|nr:YraN family protein [Nostoc sp. DedSLP05]MDZ8101594.1 YraN family protein [Nostoc sp. DedSLP01]MDZ8189526.1 YraN family protein [Nostoc sp. ChiSLP02]